MKKLSSLVLATATLLGSSLANAFVPLCYDERTDAYVDCAPVQVPEPSTFAPLAIGMLILAIAVYRARRAQSNT